MAERRRLASRAVALVLMPAANRSEPEPGLPGVFEDILLKVGSLMGKAGKASVSEAKAFVRGFGGPGVKMASRLGKLSSGRNAVVHDGFTLAEELAQLVRGVQQRGTQDCESSGQSSNDAWDAGLVILESSDNASDGGNTAARAVVVDDSLQHAGRCLLESLQVQVDKLQSRVQLLERAADRDALDVWLAEVPTAHAVAGRARPCCTGSTADHGIRQGEMLEQQLGVSDLASSGASGLAIASDANSQHPSKEGSRTIGTVTSRAKRVSRGTQAMCRAVDSSADNSNRVLQLLPQCSGEKTGNNCDKQNCLQVVFGACAETLVQLPFLSPVKLKPS